MAKRTRIGAITVVFAGVIFVTTGATDYPIGQTAKYSPMHAALNPAAYPDAITSGSGNSLTAATHTETSEIDTELRKLIERQHLIGDPTIGRSLPKLEEPKAQLGRKLFFSTVLSGNRDTACASCHHPMIGGGDGLSLPRGVSSTDINIIGPGRLLASENEEGPILPRNAPTTFNVAFFDSVMLWDGRVESFGKMPLKNGADGKGIRTPDVRFEALDTTAGPNLVAAQAKCPVVSATEMHGVKSVGYTDREARKDVRAELALRMQNMEVWRKEFRKVFGNDEITYERIADSVGEYERSQIFISSPWNQYVKGDTAALSDSAKRGAALFYRSAGEGGADCGTCHKGDKFTDEKFHVVGIPQIGRSMSDGETADDDFGRFRESRHPLDKYAFRTPSLLNVEVTGPYGRTGAYLSLDAIVRHHLNIDQSLRTYDTSKLEPSIRIPDLKSYREHIMEAIATRQKAGLFVVPQRTFTEEQIADLVSFLHTLTDPCVKDRRCLLPWVPDVATEDPKGDLNLLNAVDAHGKSFRAVTENAADSSRAKS